MTSSTTRTCKICNKEFIPNTARALACTPECKKALQKQNIAASNARMREQKRIQNNELYKDVADIPTCKICGWKSRSLQGHLKTHDLTVQQYRDQYGATNEEIFHSSYTDDKSDRMAGENNPGFNHGGTMSSFSKKNKKYADLTEAEKESAINDQIVKANKTKRENNSYTTTIDYYTSKGHTVDEAIEHRSNRQRTFSLEKCINELGEEAGTKRWLERQNKWLASLDALPQEEKDRILAAKIAALNTTYSQISHKLFESLLDRNSDLYNANFGKNEIGIQIPNGKYYKPDFAYGTKIIEFNGDFWHANPAIYESDDMLPFPTNKGTNHIQASSLWEKDRVRKEALTEMGYTVLTIWERDYKNSPELTIRQCLDFLKT